MMEYYGTITGDDEVPYLLADGSPAEALDRRLILFFTDRDDNLPTIGDYKFRLYGTVGNDTRLLIRTNLHDVSVKEAEMVMNLSTMLTLLNTKEIRDDEGPRYRYNINIRHPEYGYEMFFQRVQTTDPQIALMLLAWTLIAIGRAGDTEQIQQELVKEGRYHDFATGTFLTVNTNLSVCIPT